jgi:hypothetical protein
VVAVRADDVSSHACRVTRTTALTLSDAVITTVSFDSEIFDTDGMHDNTIAPSRITFRTAGVYLVGFQGRFASDNDYNLLQALILMNGSATIGLGQFTGAAQGAPHRVFISTIYQFVVGDYVEAQVYQDNTNTGVSTPNRDLEVVNGQSPEFWAARIGS